MILGHGVILPHPIYLYSGMVLFLVFGYFAELEIEKWRKQTGRAPAPSTNRTDQRKYRRQLLSELPAKVRTRSRIMLCVGFGLVILGFFLAGH